MFKVIPSKFIPTSILVVDDNQWFLDVLSLFMEDSRKVKSFISTVEAFSFLERHSQLSLNPVFNSTLELPNLQSHERFVNYISTIICDYDMPIEHGLEFFGKIISLPRPYQKILLTGMMQKSKGYEALEDNTIDHFLLKDDLMVNTESLSELIYCCECRLHQKFFDMHDEFPILAQEFYVNLINGIIKDNNIVEGYLLNSNGDYLVIDSGGSIQKVVFKSDISLASSPGNLDYQLLKEELDGIFSYNSFLREV